MTAPDNSDDLQTMIRLARAIVAKRPIPHMSVEGTIVALARTVLILAETPVKELKLAPTEADMAKLRRVEEAAQ